MPYLIYTDLIRSLFDPRLVVPRSTLFLDESCANTAQNLNKNNPR